MIPWRKLWFTARVALILVTIGLTVTATVCAATYFAVTLPFGALRAARSGDVLHAILTASLWLACTSFLAWVLHGLWRSLTWHRAERCGRPSQSDFPFPKRS